ncbi:PAS domain S-box protein [Geomonas sp. Red32]|uniref:PAS domain S-box protein n=1 Tax=Geomonas sp. Red32 TaxID=2912856 RepID=UPI00202CBA6C|nr:PAS domain S-box protein [Geomonas sp. Red32]MCM0084189.1 PAS domain S-box protein [Geomonas sp. Red32]
MPGEPKRTHSSPKQAARNIVLAYALLSAGWILSSDNLVALIAGSEQAMVRLSILKGWLFVALTSFLLYHLILNHLRDREESHRESSLSDDRFSTIFRGSPIAIGISIAEDGRLLDVNPTWLEMLGYLREEVIGRSSSELAIYVNGRDREGAIRELRRTGRVRNREVKLRRKSGEVIDTLCSTEMIVIGKDVCLLAMISDVTERKRAEEELRAREEIYRDLVQNANSAIVRWSRDGSITFFNEFAERFFGYRAEEAVGQPVAMLVPAGDCGGGGELSGLIGDILAHPDRYANNVNENVRRDGRRVWMTWTNTPILDQKGELTEILAVGSDVTDLKRAEERLRENEERYQTLINTAIEGFCSVNQEGRILEVNDAYCAMAGYSRDEILAMSIADLDCSESGEEVQRHVASVVAEGCDRFESRHRCRDGSEIEVEVSTVHLPNQGIFLCFIHDITQRKRSEERIEHLNRVLRAVRTVDQLIVRERDAGRFIAETCELLVEHRGFRGGMIILTGRDGRPSAYAQAGFREDFTPLARLIEEGKLPPCCCRAMEEGEPLLAPRVAGLCDGCPISSPENTCETMCVRLTHNAILYGFMAVVLDDGQGCDQEEVALFGELASDVAFALYTFDQAQAMQTVQAERDRFEAELRQAQKMDAIGQLAGGIAHDFNNMLSVILGVSNLALERLTPQDPLYRELLQIERAGQRSADLTRQLLAFSRKQGRQPEVVNLNRVIDYQRSMLSRLIGEEIRIVFQPAPSLWNIKIDPSQMDQILTNLAVNARDAIGGVGSITLATGNATIDGEAARILGLSGGEYVRLAISDTGSGIDKVVLERIFEPFFTTKGKGKGTGLGLSTVYGIVKQNEGGISVESVPGRGTTFIVHFPRCLEEEIPLEGVTAGVPLRGTETVLVVEDEEQVVSLIGTILESHGYTVLTALSAEEAMECCRSHPDEIHLLLADVVMPTMNGRELQARVEEIRPAIRTLFMSGYTADIVAGRGVIREGAGFLSKPFTATLLTKKVREVLDDR